MDLICPDCRGELRMASAREAVCAQHGGRFEVLFDRSAAAAVPQALSSAPVAAASALGHCADHPEMEAVARCRLCAKRVCATCDFAMPGGVHLCPACIESQSSADVSPKRKKQTYIGLALAIWSTILLALLVGGAFNSFFTPDAGGKAADMVVTNIILWPLLIGTGVSVGALDKRLTNTGLMKGVAWWNGILAALFLLLVIAVNAGLIGS